MEDKNDRLNTRRKPLALAMGSFRNGDYIRSLDNKGLSVVLGVIIDEFIIPDKKTPVSKRSVGG